jgi:hypothetical protein
MNATAHVRPTAQAAATGGSMADDNASVAPEVPSFSYARVAAALADGARTPHMLTVTAQLAALLRARIGSGELARGKPLPDASALMQQYGVTEDTVAAAVRVLVAEGLAYVVEGRGAYVA